MMIWKFSLLVAAIFVFAVCIVFFIQNAIYKKDVKSQVNYELYHLAQIGKTLKYGALFCFVGIFVLLAYILIEYYWLDLRILSLLRIIPLILMAIFIIGKYSFLQTSTKAVIPLYTIIYITCFFNIGALLVATTMNTEHSITMQFCGLIGGMVHCTYLSLIAFGARRYFTAINSVWLIMLISIHLIIPDTTSFLMLIPILIISIIINVNVERSEKNDFEKYIIYKSLQKRELELQQQSVEIFNQNEQLTRSNQLLENFAHQVSHDLKEPLKTIKSFGKVLKNKYEDELDDNYSKYLDLMTNSSTRMDNLIQGLLSFSKIKGQNFKSTTEVNLNNVLQDVKLNLQSSIEKNQATVIGEKLPIIFARHSLVVQIFQNIISNSIKFQPDGQKAFVSVESKLNRNYHHIAIKDNGIGIEKNQLNKVFNTFTRLNPQSKYEGSGIGLSTCLAIIKGYGGHINIDSIRGVGTTFNIYFPKVKVNTTSLEIA